MVDLRVMLEGLSCFGRGSCFTMAVLDFNRGDSLAYQAFLMFLAALTLAGSSMEDSNFCSSESDVKVLVFSDDCSV